MLVSAVQAREFYVSSGPIEYVRMFGYNENNSLEEDSSLSTVASISFSVGTNDAQYKEDVLIHFSPIETLSDYEATNVNLELCKENISGSMPGISTKQNCEEINPYDTNISGTEYTWRFKKSDLGQGRFTATLTYSISNFMRDVSGNYWWQIFNPNKEIRLQTGCRIDSCPKNNFKVNFRIPTKYSVIATDPEYYWKDAHPKNVNTTEIVFDYSDSIQIFLEDKEITAFRNPFFWALTGAILGAVLGILLEWVLFRKGFEKVQKILGVYKISKIKRVRKKKKKVKRKYNKFKKAGISKSRKKK